MNEPPNATPPASTPEFPTSASTSTGLQPDFRAPSRAELGPYRLGYREGFSDGFGEAERHADAQKDGDRDGDKDQKGNEKQGGAPQDGDKNGGDKKGGDQGGDGKSGGEKDDGDDEKDGGANKTPLYKRPFAVGGILLVVLLLIVAAILFWRHSSRHATTDDAFIDGYTSQVAAQVGGRVQKVYIVDNQHVNAGDPLIDIDSRDNDVKVAQARGQLASSEGQYEQAQAQIAVQRANAAQADEAVRQADADLLKAVQDLARYRTVNPDAVPRQQVDAAVASEREARAKRDGARASARAAHAMIEADLAQVRAGKAQVDAAKSNVDAAGLQSSYTHVVAPIGGRIARRTVDTGNVINTGQALMAVVSDVLWVTANYKETQLTDMKAGQSVEIVVDAYPDVTFHGRVDSIQRATGQYFSMLPAENATGNYVKVTQRVPVKITFTDNDVRNYVIGPGMSVTPDVTLR